MDFEKVGTLNDSVKWPIPTSKEKIKSIFKWYKWVYLQNRNRLTDFKNKLTVIKEEMLGGGN